MAFMNYKKTKELNIFHGPNNTGGLGGHLALYQREMGYKATACVYNDNFYLPNSDLNLDLKNKNPLLRIFISIHFFINCLIKYNTFHFYFGRTFFHLGLDLPILKLFGKKMIMTYCGSEIRLFKDVENKRNPYSHLVRNKYNNPLFDEFKKVMMWWHNIWIHKFFAVRSLYFHSSVVIPKKKLIKDLWINNVIDPQSFHPSFKTNKIPVLVHAPSNPEVKGSAYIEKAIADLKHEGFNFIYKRVENLPFEKAKKIYQKEADIIIDQVLLGDFGCLAVEAMSFGKPVCCYLAKDIASEMPDCPIVNCNIDNLKEKLSYLIRNPDERIRIGKESRNYVVKVLNKNKICIELINCYKSLHI
ncbi:MAG: hypothetical protein A2Y03_07320 [Omnitrophica WOR_2 bacterium GWF2_38_59]|nr:MAG: hypothetical protein A2Y03_07320 [Omnitrophica WOR_2 bacterium GWF2_38_59]OGX48871.1 MAG: hypothetical protein A2243_07620 [Omnitrophica WOR_2 bacterium RIFOXYA2_FULL_38_17]OGX52739.1 MAG: hypothetical protein A2267_10880 [Omnitrophica WOR_2 bacterium RIFOXYA12_FULL_38_10]OGX56845.1 MAG: hypothetical protein A2306_05430 [Omnitrophica WOR_2 bacterium RIFOXYB2_FULL_38_16]HBG60809.1 hypothetical protein [Candidatus Omnitrophota bacterium]